MCPEKAIRDHEMIAAQDLLDFFQRQSIEPTNRGPNRHNRGDPYDDADQSEKSAQFMGKNRLQGDLLARQNRRRILLSLGY